MLLLASLTFAASLRTASLDAPVPNITDLDYLPEPGAWPCALTLQVDGLGAVNEVKVARGCPSGLIDTAKQIGAAWKWQPNATAHSDELAVTFHMLGMTDVEPKVASTPGSLVFLLRANEVLTPPPATTEVAGPDGAPITQVEYELQKVPKLKPPKSAEALGVVAGSCLVRLEVGEDGKVTSARATRCLDVLAGPAVAGAKQVKFKAREGTKPPAEYDLVVRFATPE
jgi:hypothetical protein